MVEHATYHPPEFYAVELWGAGAEIRLITKLFAQRLGNGDARLLSRSPF